MTVGKSDFFMEHPEALKEGAKLVLGRLVRDEIGCMSVPRIFDSLEAAIKSGVPFIIRSDHPDEYHSLAGIFDSVKPRREDGGVVVNFYDAIPRSYPIRSEDDLSKLLTEVAYGQFNFVHYLKLNGIKAADLMRDFRFSLWEYVDGVNGAMFADPVVPDKYHFLQISKNAMVYLQLNTSTGKLEIAGEGWRDRELLGNLPNGKKTLFGLIEAYEQIRNSAKLNGSHCYEMEYEISDNGGIYFLQLRRLRDFSPSSFKLERAPEEGEREGSFVIGKTGQEGVILKTHYPSNHPVEVDNSVEAIVTLGQPLAASRYPRLKAVIFNHSSLDYFALRALTHQSRTLMARANLVTHLPFRGGSEIRGFVGRPLRYVSDGERCLVKQM